MQNAILEAALFYHDLGWSLIPIKPGTKVPAIRSWKQYQKERASVEQLHKWFDTHPERSIAVILGPVSGDLFCRDFDDLAGYEQWKGDSPELAASLPTTGTSRGRHVYCRSEFGRIVKLNDGELRGAGYCVLPPSNHPNGTRYEWIILPHDSIPHLDLAESKFLCPSVTETTESTEITESPETTQENRRQLKPVVGEGIGLVGLEFDSAIQAIFSRTLPLSSGKRNLAVFELARGLKSMPGFSEADPNVLKEFVRQWHSLALPNISTQPFEDTWIDFLRAWPRVKFPAGLDPMSEILKRAQQASESDWPYESQGLRLLASLCRELQRAMGAEPFFLSCRKAGSLLGIHHVRAYRWLWLLENDKIIQTVTKGDRQTQQATRFRYISSL